MGKCSTHHHLHLKGLFKLTGGISLTSFTVNNEHMFHNYGLFQQLNHVIRQENLFFLIKDPSMETVHGKAIFKIQFDVRIAVKACSSSWQL